MSSRRKQICELCHEGLRPWSSVPLLPFLATAPSSLSNAGPHLEGHMLVLLVRFATRCEDFLGQIFGKFRVPFRPCQSAFYECDCRSEGHSVASAQGASSEMCLERCACRFREFSVMPS